MTLAEESVIHIQKKRAAKKQKFKNDIVRQYTYAVLSKAPKSALDAARRLYRNLSTDAKTHPVKNKWGEWQITEDSDGDIFFVNYPNGERFSSRDLGPVLAYIRGKQPLGHERCKWGLW